MCVSSELGQKGRDWKQWADDKAADKSTLLRPLSGGFASSQTCFLSLSLRYIPGLSCLVDLLPSGRETPREALGSIMN